MLGVVVKCKQRTLDFLITLALFYDGDRRRNLRLRHAIPRHDIKESRSLFYIIFLKHKVKTVA